MSQIYSCSLVRARNNLIIERNHWSIHSRGRCYSKIGVLCGSLVIFVLLVHTEQLPLQQKLLSWKCLKEQGSDSKLLPVGNKTFASVNDLEEKDQSVTHDHKQVNGNDNAS